MRSPPQPALQNVLVTRPGSSPVPNTVALRDDLLPLREVTAAVLAAEDAHESRSRPRSVLARVTRGFSRFSDALRRRRKDEKRPRDGVTPQIVRFDHRGRVTMDTLPEEQVERIQPAPSHVILHRERELRMAREEGSEADTELTVSSTRDASLRRVRQVGARDDDDTLLMLPRVAAVRLSPPSAKKDSPQDGEGKRVKLPRVSALMPTRATSRPSSGLASASPVSSAGKTSSHEQDSDDDSSESSDSEHYEGERLETWDVADVYMRRRAFCRLPTGLSNKDVEREIDRAVVEIASEEDSEEVSEEDSDDQTDEEDNHELKPAPQHVEVTKSRALSDAHHQMQLLKPDLFARRASSSMQARRRIVEDEEGEALSLIGGDKSRFRGSHDVAMFEDDYLSFQGFQGKHTSDGRSYQTMASLLRSKRISSVTDSLSEESEEASNLRGTRSTDSRNRRELGGLLSPKVYRKRQTLSDAMD